MYINHKTGCIAVGTVGSDAEYKKVGNKNTPLINWNMAVGKKDNGETLWFSCKAWNPIATRFNGFIKKGDVVQVFGVWEKREYNNNTYYTLMCQFISILDSPAKNGNRNGDGFDDDIGVNNQADDGWVNDDDMPF